MLPSYVAVLKANTGELNAVSMLDSKTARRLCPLFEIGKITDSIRERKYILQSRTPIATHLDRILDKVAKSWSSRDAMVDGYHWPADAQTEHGDHVIPYIVSGLRERNVPAIPVVGYDRWGNTAYRLGIKAIPPRSDRHYCLRLDRSGIDDAAEPQHFEEVISEIIEELALEPTRCSVLLDFEDVSLNSMSVEAIVNKGRNIVEQLEPFGFGYYIVAGSSFPRSIDLAVSSRDSVGMVLRKEMLAWQALRGILPNIQIVTGDYGVRGPTTTETRSKYTNGKIRHTVKHQVFVARGHAFYEDHNNMQMETLANTVVTSPHFLGDTFSWGDAEIGRCQREGAFGSTTTWIAIDTNHHLTFVVQEVLEFEKRVPAYA